MKAVIHHAFGGPEVLALEAAPDPRPAADEVVVRVHAVSINPTLDFGTRAGRYARPVPLPHVPGADPSGEIVALGADVAGWAIGDRVWADFLIGCDRCPTCAAGRPRACPNNEMLGVTRWGGYAEQVAVPARALHRVPDGLDFATATVVGRHFPLAMHLLEQRGRVQAGNTVLVMGATGGLGNACVQVARHHGARVIAGVGSDARAASALAAGADHAVNYRDTALAAEVARLTEARGVAIVCENVGDADLWPAAFECLASGGRLVTAGAHAGGRVMLDLHRLYLRRLSILGGADVAADGIARAFALAAQGRIDPGIAEIVPLAGAIVAQARVAARAVIGKVVIAPQQDA